MGIFDVHAKTWQAPSRQEQAHKNELHLLEEAEDRKRRQMKNELDTLRKVEDLQQESAVDARKFLQENARDSARRRAISGLDNRQALALAQHERNTAVLRHTAGHPGALLSPNMAMLSSPAMSSMGSMHVINVPQSPGMLGSGLCPNMGATPRVRTVSALHTPLSPSLGGYHGSPSLGLPLPRPRAISSAGLGAAATVERIRLEERKRALLQKEAMLQAGREQRLMEKKSMLDLDAQEIALRRQAQELDARMKLESNDRFLDGQEARLQHRQKEVMLEAEMAERLRHLNVNTPSLNPLNGSSGLGHTRHLSSPMALGVDADRSPRLNPMLNASMMGDSLLGSNLLPNDNYGRMGHQRSTSVGQSPHLGTHALDASMAAEAARLNILPNGLGMNGLGHGGLGSNGIGGFDDRAAAYSRAGVSPRFGPVDVAYNQGYGIENGALGGMYGGQDPGLDGLGTGGRYGRSRSGSLGQGNDFSLGSSGLGPGYGGDAYGRGRRDSLPFQY